MFVLKLFYFTAVLQNEKKGIEKSISITIKSFFSIIKLNRVLGL